MEQITFSKQIEKILEKLDFSRLGKNVAIKVHFGEKGCTTFTNPEIVRKVYNAVIDSGRKATLVECNVLYKGERMKASSHIKLAKEHGFVRMNIDILDGEDGNEFVNLNGCKIGKGIEKYDSMIVLSHFKGHEMAGFGGALKNLGMGLGSRAGKLHMHSNISPSIGYKCTGCGLCIENCGSDAITLVNGKAVIDPKKCTGCAMCIAFCVNKAVNIPWGSQTSEALQKKIAQYSKAIVDKIGKDKMIYINILEKITKDCDCMSIGEKPIMEDIGILAGADIVAVDKASLDLANKQDFDKINKVNKEFQLDYGEEIGLGSKEYELINI